MTFKECGRKQAAAVHRQCAALGVLIAVLRTLGCSRDAGEAQPLLHQCAAWSRFKPGTRAMRPVPGVELDYLNSDSFCSKSKSCDEASLTAL